MRRFVAIALLLIAAVLVATGLYRRSSRGSARFDVQRKERPVLVVTFDTTRADHLGPYGYEDVSTPTLDRMAEQGIVFERAYAATPITLPSHTSIMTGLYPFQHGVRNNGLQYVPARVTTLAERLKGEGYRTAAFVSAAVLDRRYGLDQGFELYDDDLSTGRNRRPRQVADRPAEATVDAATAWLDSLDPGERFFLWVHFYDPHAAYSPPPPYRDDYRQRPYDGEIAYADSQLGRLLQHPRIRGGGETEEPIVAMLADHGESLGEHGEQTHAILAYDSTLHVPWILRIPGGPAGVRIQQPVGHVDLAPTLLGLLGLDGGHDMAGRDLVPLIEGQPLETNPPPYYSETYLPYYTYGWAKLRAIRRGDWKYVDAPTPELYYLKKDPRELSNQFGSQPGLAHDLKRDLEELLASVEDSEHETTLALDADAAEKLRSLGYLATGSSRSRQPHERPDPKEMVDLHVAMERARVLLDDRLFEQAAGQLRVVLTRDPENLSALIDLAAALEGQGDLDEAVRVVERALEIDPDHLRLAVSLAKLEAARGNLDKAVELSRIAVQKDPKSPEAQIQLANLLTSRGSGEEARVSLEAALAVNPESAPLNLGYARLFELRLGKLEEAETRVRAVLDRDPFLTGGWLILGQILERTDQPQEAADSYREGLRRRSDDPELHGLLGHLLAKIGDRAEAEQHLREAIRLSTEFKPTLHVSLGGLLAEAGRFEDSQREYDKVLQVQPEHPGARNNAAIALWRSGHPDEADAMLQELVAQFPAMADAHNNLAALNIDRGRWQAVEFYARKALEADPKMVQAWNNLAVALEEQEKTSEARSTYDRAIALDPDYWQAHFNLGLFLRKQGEPGKAAAEFERVLSRVPQQPEAHLELAEIYAEELEDPGKARVHYNAFLRHAPEHPRAAEARRRIAALPSG